MEVLRVDNLHIGFHDSFEIIKGVSFKINKGEILGIVGESGCGKSVTALSTIGFIPDNSEISEGNIYFLGEKLDEYKMKEIRGRGVGIIFQDSMNGLNPVKKVGKQIIEGIILNNNISVDKAKAKALHIMESTGLRDVDKIYDSYPHELSGGMKQRIMISIALIGDAKLIIADEPTASLDVTTAAQILKLIKNINEENHTSFIIISHDIESLANICDKILVMYRGLVVEYGKTSDVLYKPKHPYTKGLIKSIPNYERRDELLYSIKGQVEPIEEKIKGCQFKNRCDRRFELCDNYPPMFQLKDNHESRCFLYMGK